MLTAGGLGAQMTPVPSSEGTLLFWIQKSLRVVMATQDVYPISCDLPSRIREGQSVLAFGIYSDSLVVVVVVVVVVASVI